MFDLGPRGPAADPVSFASSSPVISLSPIRGACWRIATSIKVRFTYWPIASQHFNLGSTPTLSANNLKALNLTSAENIVSIDRVLPPAACWSGGAIAQLRGELFESEREAIKRAVPSRRQEFLAGRIYAREALRALGFDAVEIGVGTKRQPLWPATVSGSITHQDDFCIAAVSKINQVRFLGIDLASTTALDENLRGQICTDAEIASIQRLTSLSIDPYKLIFSFKESIFKCVFPAIGHHFGFHAVTVSIEDSGESARIECMDASLLELAALQQLPEIRFCQIGNYLLTTAWSN